MSTYKTISDEDVDLTEKHVRAILPVCMEHTDEHVALVVYDERCELAKALGEAYRRVLPKAVTLNFDQVTPVQIFAEFDRLRPKDLVVLIQSTNFRLEAFRIRVELFKRELKVIEHPHLSRMLGAEQVRFYIESLAYDSAYYRGVGRALKEKIDQAPHGTVDTGDGDQLVFSSPFEISKLNIGDYTGMRNIGGQFPIGEVFTEAKDLEAVNGRLRVSVFGDTTFTANKPEKPITLVISKGRVVDVLDSTEEFDKVLANIRADEAGEIWVRELGFGMNRAFTKDRMVSDIGTYERMCGIHLSLGAKHGLYKKPYFEGKTMKHHVDVFAATESVTLGNVVVYQNGAWVV
jgi:aminopeptidase